MILVALYQNDSFVSRLIRFWTHSKYSHSEVWNTDIGESVSAEAHGVVLKQMPVLTRHGRGQKVDAFSYDRPLSLEEEQAVWRSALGMVGWKYDYFSVFLGFTLGLKEPKASLSKWFCSEVVVEAFRLAKLPLLRRTPASRVSPRDLAMSTKLKFQKTFITQ